MRAQHTKDLAALIRRVHSIHNLQETWKLRCAHPQLFQPIDETPTAVPEVVFSHQTTSKKRKAEELDETEEGAFWSCVSRLRSDVVDQLVGMLTDTAAMTE